MRDSRLSRRTANWPPPSAELSFEPAAGDSLAGSAFRPIPSSPSSLGRREDDGSHFWRSAAKTRAAAIRARCVPICGSFGPTAVLEDVWSAIRPSGRGLHRICRAEIAERPAASRDGRQIAFLDYRPTPDGNFWHVRVVRENGRCAGRVGAATSEWTLRWSPDGTRLLWENDGERLVVGWADGRGRPRVLTRGALADWRYLSVP
jgi:hypothetical protein